MNALLRRTSILSLKVIRVLVDPVHAYTFVVNRGFGGVRRLKMLLGQQDVGKHNGAV